MSEKELRSALFHWYREAINGNPRPFVAILRSVETFYLFDLISDDLYSVSMYLSEDLIELKILDCDGNVIPLPEPEDIEFPFPEFVLPKEEVPSFV